MTTKQIGFIFLSLLASGAAIAAPKGLLPNCYTYANLSAPNAPPTVELFVLIDQTTPLGSNLQQAAADIIKPFLKQGNAFSIIQFSAFTQGHYTDVLASERLSQLIEQKERNAIGKVQLAKFDKCMSVQGANAAKIAGAALRKAYAGTTSDMAKSDILFSLKDISIMINRSDANEKVVLLVSDMLENSSITTFYANRGVRKIDPAKEYSLVKSNNLLGDFGGARIYVMGAGLLSDDAKLAKGVYRDPKTMLVLQQFWKNYFQNANGELIEFGQPALLNPVQ
ncbi:hypothetical protein [Cellvibrio sp. UBA7661]|uniref:hypothetical protein n=1 Tax=Cellvibrio sp. UBA7661 TaxID=1946311 RepID=UPI002F35EC3B